MGLEGKSNLELMKTLKDSKKSGTPFKPDAVIVWKVVNKFGLVFNGLIF